MDYNYLFQHYAKRQGESAEDYKKRIYEAKAEIGNWRDVALLLNNQLGLNHTESKYRKEAKLLRCQEALADLLTEDDETEADDVGTQPQPDATPDDGGTQFRESIERQKLFTEKLELNRWLRVAARDEMILERIETAIRELPDLEVPMALPRERGGDRVGILVFGDTHFGAEFIIPTLDGQGILNKYDEEVFVDRMEDLLEQVMDICAKEGLTKIKVYSMGDELDGVLRVSQLQKLRYGVVESTIRYSEYICRWLARLTKFVRVEFRMLAGNHTELRMLGQPKGTFENENMSIIIKEFIRVRMEDNPNFDFIDSKSGLIYDEVFGLNIVGIHGETKDLSKTIKDLTNQYNVRIDILLAAHLHHSASQCIGLYRDVIRVPSIIGVDPYAMTLSAISNPGATFLIIEEGKGKSITYDIKL